MNDQTKNLVWPEMVDPREIWGDESGVFTPWLAKPDNLTRLGQALGLALEEPATEVSVGGYSADIVATNTANDRRVVIESQLERTDHDHLGKVLTYAAGLDALTVVWIAKQFTQEHRATLEWLNQHTSADIGFFGIEIEVRKIDDSRYSPRFNVVAMPNEWTKSLPAKKLTPTTQAQLEFWRGFKSYASSHAKRITPTAPQPQNWMDMSIGRADFRLNAVAPAFGWDSREPEIRAELVMYSKDAKQHFDRLSEARSEIDASFSPKPEWYSEAGVRQRKVYFRKSVDWRDPDEQEGCYEWLVKNLDRLHKVFQPRLHQLP